MNVNTKFKEAPVSAATPVIEQVWGEKPGGGLIANPTFEIKQGTAVYADGTKFLPIKAYRLIKAVDTDDTTIEIAKGSGIAVGDKIGHAKKSVACTAVDTTTYADKDVVTVTLGVVIAAGVVLYEAATASSAAAAPKSSSPVYVVGNDVPAGEGDFAVRLINGANLRKETAPIAEEVVALMSNINLV